jgi:hypothetical protein
MYMNSFRVVAIVLIIAGVLGLVYGSFTYVTDKHNADLGPIDLEVNEKETVNVPVWTGVSAIAVGGLLLLLASRTP